MNTAEQHRIVRVRQTWPISTAEVDIVYDPEGLPIRVWRRTTMPDAHSSVGHLDLRVYDLSSGASVRMARRGPNGEREGVAIAGPRPRVIIAPGRGALSAWFQSADLEVGARVREPKKTHQKIYDMYSKDMPI